MAGRVSSLLFLSVCCLLAVHPTYGGYMITTPREVTVGVETQICIFVIDPAAPEGRLEVEVGTHGSISSFPEPVPLFNTTINVPAGRTDLCQDILVSDTEYRSRYLNVRGEVDGQKLDHSVSIRIRQSSFTERVFIQTDKHFYQAGETVQIRVLTVTGPILNVSTDNYLEIFVQTPSKTRIAQWLDVDNSQGIVHLNMQLVDEPEEGYYNIHVKTADDVTTTQNFRVGEYVLPRFEVKVKNPPYILSTDARFNFSVCATYTFGQPVKGNVTVVLNNNQQGLCRTYVTRQVNVTGCQSFEFTTEEMQVTDCNVHSMNAKVTFEEEGTGVREEFSSSLSITRNAINFKEIYADKYMKPNLPLTVKVRTEYPDGSPASDILVEVCAAGKCNNMTTSPDGHFIAVLPAYRTNRIFMKALNCRADLHQSSYSKNVEHYYSPSNSSILIHAPEEALKCVSDGTLEHNLPLLFSATNQTSALITVQVISRGQIQYTSTKEYRLDSTDLPISNEHLVEPLQKPPKDTVRGVLNIPLSLPTTVSPKAKILVWYTRKDGEVVSDLREIHIEKCLRNSANLTWATKQGQPGDETILSLKSKPNSVCGLGVVDKSTLLLSEAPGKISVASLFRFLETFDISPWTKRQTNDYEYCKDKHEKELAASLKGASGASFRGYDYYSLYVDALKLFDESGLYAITDLTVETRPCEKREQAYFAFEADDIGAGGFGGGGVFAQASPGAGRPVARPPPNRPTAEGDFLDKESDFDSPGESDSPRTDFPETWLWDVVVVPPSGEYTQSVTLPDTVTEWVGSAVCALPNEGIGISGDSSIRTFLPFFVDLTLPFSIKRGEILPVKISVFNYLDKVLPVTVILEESPEYVILEEPLGEALKGKKSICLESRGKDVLTFKIDSLIIGDVNLTISAFVDYDSAQDCPTTDQSVTRRDAIIKPIKVEAEGYPREKTWTKYICHEDVANGEDDFDSWDMATPPGIVEGSERGWVTAVGDLLALSLENLGSLIRMPYGCGEQNMINFAPNIFIMQYLDVTKQNTAASSEKLKRFMTTGYRRELLYRHNDGAFSAFGNADDFGSTWLTAFVLKSFAQARPYILIDEEALNETRTWLQDKQDLDGCFLSIGKVFHKGMQGGIESGNNSIPLTTYVMISLLEAGEDPEGETIVLARRCINSDTSTDPYTMALKAYAFTLAKLPQAKDAIEQLLTLATVAKNSTYWELPKTPSKSKATELETAAYAILAMVEQDFDTYRHTARKIIKWIMAQRNGRGGFYSTQDTVMALQAMAKYESFLYQGQLNITANVVGSGFDHSFTLTDSNKLLQQQVSIPSFPTSLKFSMEGQGCGVFQGVLRYNIPEPEATDAFDLTVNSGTEPDRQCKTKLITACTSYKLPDGKSNMVVMEVNLVSGYIPEKEDLKALVRQNPDVLKRYEVDGSKVSFYIEELTAEATCINFKILREVDVENVKPGTVVVYDYYQPEFFISENYILPPPDECR